MVSTKWLKGNRKKITKVIETQNCWFPRTQINTVYDLEAAAELIVVVRALDDLTERQQLLLYLREDDSFPRFGASIAQVEVLRVIKKPSTFVLPSSKTLPISEPVYVFTHPEAGPDGLVLRRMAENYRELKKGKTYLLFLGVEPKDDVTRNAGLLYGVVAPSLAKYNLDGGDPQDDVELEEAYRLRDKLPMAQRRQWQPPATKKQQWKATILKRYADHLR
ncbi:MAG: hypothetical protein H7145_12455 [Akkermansiaceae bacterium]|nr:hypothetical protein [Armatimonadota bacterium]